MSKTDVKTRMTGALAGMAGTAGVYLAIMLLHTWPFSWVPQALSQCGSLGSLDFLNGAGFQRAEAAWTQKSQDSISSIFVSVKPSQKANPGLRGGKHTPPLEGMPNPWEGFMVTIAGDFLTHRSQHAA